MRAVVLCGAAYLAPVESQAVPVARMRSRLFTFTHPAMATTFTLYLYSDDAARASAVSEEVFDEVDRVEQLLSNYRETSELSRINRDASAGAVTTDPEMMEFLAAAERWSRVSDGAFDMTVGRLMKAWGFYRHQGAVPPADELERIRSVTGWRKVELDPSARTVRFAESGVELDTGGIGKGFAVDACVRILREDGVRALSVVMLRDESLSSADCSQKNFVAGGHLYCHIMDPRTMRPVEGRTEVSVVHPSATASDALSNVVFVQKPEQSLRTLAASAPEGRALIVSGDAGHATCALFRWQVKVDESHCTILRARRDESTGRRVQ